MLVLQTCNQDTHVVLRNTAILDEVFDVGVLVAHFGCLLDELLFQGCKMLICLFAYGAIALDRFRG